MSRSPDRLRAVLCLWVVFGWLSRCGFELGARSTLKLSWLLFDGGVDRGGHGGGDGVSERVVGRVRVGGWEFDEVEWVAVDDGAGVTDGPVL